VTPLVHYVIYYATSYIVVRYQLSWERAPCVPKIRSWSNEPHDGISALYQYSK